MEEEKFEISPEEFVLMACGPDLDYKERIDACLARNPGLANATSEGASALMYAANHDCIEIIGSLLNNGADVNYMVNGIWTSLHCAIVQKREAAASMLITAGANVNIADHAGQTPLHLACSRNLLSTAKLLIKYGAIPSITDNDDLLPLDLWDDSDLEGKLAVIAAIEDGLDDLDLQAAATAESSGPAFPSVDHLQDSDDKIAEAVERGRRLGEAATNELSSTGKRYSRPATATGGVEGACTVNEVLARLIHGHSGPIAGHDYDYNQSLGQSQGLDDTGQSEDSVADDETRAGLGDNASVGATPEVASNYNCLTLPITGVINMASKLCGGGNQNDDEEASASFLFRFGFWAKPMPPRGSPRSVGQNTRQAAATAPAPAASPINPDAAPAATPAASAPGRGPAASHSVADTVGSLSQAAPRVAVASGVNTAEERSPNFRQQAEDVGEGAGDSTGVGKAGLSHDLVTPAAPVCNPPAVATTPGPQIHTSRPPPTVAGVVTGTGGGTGSDLPQTTQRSRDLSQHSCHHNSQLNNLSLSSRKDAPLIEGFTTPLRSDGISSAPYLTVTRSTVTRSQSQSMSMSQRHGQQTPPVRLVETIIYEPYKLDISGDEEDDKDKTKQDNAISGSGSGSGSGGNSISNSPSGEPLVGKDGQHTQSPHSRSEPARQQQQQQQGAEAHTVTPSAPSTAVPCQTPCQTSSARIMNGDAVHAAHSQITPVAENLGSHGSGGISASDPAAIHQQEPSAAAAAAAAAAADGLEAYAAAAAAARAAQLAPAVAATTTKLQSPQQLQGPAQDGAKSSTSISAAHVSPPPPSSEVAGDAPDFESRSSAVAKPGSPSQLTSAAAAVP